MIAEEGLLRELKTKESQTAYLLERYPSARDCDFMLQYLWLKDFGNLSTKLPFLQYQEVMAVGGQLESVRRMRQKLQNEKGMYPASPEVKAKRTKRAHAFRKAIKQT